MPPPDDKTLQPTQEAASPRPPASEALHATLETPAILTRGSQLGRYLILECLGSGGIGVVYSAFDPVLERKVAVKLLRAPSDDGAGAVARARLLREAQAMARVTHPHVVTIHDAGEWAGQVFIAMELVPGASLALWGRDTPRSWRDVLELYLQAGQGLAAVHRAGLIHRDFKPANVLVRDDRHALVTDFGLAYFEEAARAPADLALLDLSNDTQTTLTLNGTLIGTPAYMAPEQILCERADARSDQFSFCVALWEALFGSRPFSRAATMGQLIEHIRAGRFAETKGADAPSWLRAILIRGLAADPRARFESMGALLSALGRGSRKRARTKLLVGGVTLGVSAVIASFAGWRMVEDRACEVAAREIDTSWGARRDAIAESFRHSGLSHAEGAFEGVRRTVDAYAARWSAIRRETCLAARRGDASDVEVAQRVLCLSRRKSQLEAFTQLLDHPTQELVTVAPTVAHALASIDSCLRGGNSNTALPEDPALGERVQALRQQLDAADVGFEAGRYQEGIEAVRRVSEEARSLGFEPLLAESLVMLGMYQFQLNEKGTEETLIEGARRALAVGADDLAYTGWLRLVGISLRATDVAGAQRWLDLARAALDRQGGAPDSRAEFELTRANVLRAQSRFEDALAASERAIEILRAIAPGTPFLADALDQSGANLATLGRIRESVLRHEEALALLEKAVGSHHPAVALSLANVCADYRALGEPGRAYEACHRSLAIREKVLGPNHLDLAPAINVLGVLASNAGETTKAIALYRRALQIRESNLGPDHPLVALQLSNLAATLRRSQPDESLEVIARVLEICREGRTGCEGTVPFTLLYRADIAFQAKRFSAARADYEQARARFTAAFGADHPHLGDALLGLGKVELVTGNPAAAIPLVERAIDLGTLAPGRAKWPQLRFTLARALWDAKRDPVRARELAEQATEELTGSSEHAAMREEIRQWLASRPVDSSRR